MAIPRAVVCWFLAGLLVLGPGAPPALAEEPGITDLVALDRLEEAAARAQAELKRAPDSVEAMPGLAVVHVNRFQSDRAKELIARARQLAPAFAKKPERIGLALVSGTGFDSPAISDRLQVRVQFAYERFSASGAPAAYVEHAVARQVASLLIVIQGNEPSGGVGEWISQGLSDHLANGRAGLRAMGQSEQKALESPLSLAEMDQRLNIIAPSSGPGDVWMQSALMVEELASRMKDRATAIERLLTLRSRLSRHTPFETALRDLFGLTPAELQAAWQARARSATPSPAR